MIKHLLWLVFLHKYYIPMMKEYTKPLKINYISHKDISALIDPYIQAYIDFEKDLCKYKYINSNSYFNLHKSYILPKFIKLVDSRLNRHINSVWTDIQSFFSSKISKMAKIRVELDKICLSEPNEYSDTKEFKTKLLIKLARITDLYNTDSKTDPSQVIENIKMDILEICSKEDLIETVNKYKTKVLDEVGVTVRKIYDLLNVNIIENELMESIKSLCDL